MERAAQELQVLIPPLAGDGAQGSTAVAADGDDVPAVPMSSVPMNVEASGGSVFSAGHAEVVENDPGLAVPVTPPREFVMVPPSPRGHGESRPSESAEDETAKRQRVEEFKRQRIKQMKMEYEERLSEVRLAFKEYLQWMTMERI